MKKLFITLTILASSIALAKNERPEIIFNFDNLKSESSVNTDSEIDCGEYASSMVIAAENYDNSLTSNQLHEFGEFLETWCNLGFPRIGL